MIQHYTLTLTGSVQRLDEALPASQRGKDEIPQNAIQLQPDGANSNPVYIGGANATLSSANHGFRLEPGATGVPQAPWLFDQRETRLSEWSVLGTNNEKLHIFVDTRV